MSQLPKFTMVDAAPAPVSSFPHAAEADGWVFLTGQMPPIRTTTMRHCRKASRPRRGA
ncbi:MAG: RidA/YER057c/UK114 superfamily protein [uncultured Caballeronia sp.]|nr:MAG: RidA/YER057c/UK114 superfamily protein [uncultured Caballeronia sp.]